MKKKLVYCGSEHLAVLIAQLYSPQAYLAAKADHSANERAEEQHFAELKRQRERECLSAACLPKTKFRMGNTDWSAFCLTDEQMVAQ
eukprot:SAG31_NODE_55_length_29938_cov_9.154027_8_plen_87_part_00